MKFFAGFLVLLASTSIFASPSAHRDAWRDAESYYPTRPLSKRSGGTAFSRKQALSQVDLSAIPAVSDLSFVEAKFQIVRDKRFLTSSDNRNFLRRLSWLYPDDGCYARAEMAARVIGQQGEVQPAKIFIFGNLHAETPNSVTGEVNWWYHVAVAYRTAEGVFILDPAVEPKKPLLLAEWVHQISPYSRDPKLSICAAASFEPDSECLAPTPISQEKAEREAENYLPTEWDRMLELNRKPEKVLGDFPPWL